MLNTSKLVALGLALALSACAVANPDTDPQVSLGDFSLGHNVVVTQNARKVGPSRNATPEEWETLLEGEIAKRFDRHTGDKLYHLGINLDGYALAIPGVPVVLAPKSLMLVTVNVWDDAAGVKLADEPRQLTVFEQFDGGTIIGSGLTRSREEQMSNLAAQMAAAVERYLLANGEWFGIDPDAEAVAASEADVLKIPDDAAPSEPVPEAALPSQPTQRPSP